MKKNFILTFIMLFCFMLVAGCSNEPIIGPGRTFKIQIEDASVEEGQNITCTVPGFENENVIWASEDDSIATVANGQISGISAGSCKISAKYGSYGDSILVTVLEKGSNKGGIYADSIKKLLSNMSVEEKIGQLFMVGISGTSLEEDDINYIKEYHFGNVYLNDYNIESGSQLATLTKAIQKELKKDNSLYGFIGTTYTLGQRNNMYNINKTNFPYNMIIGNTNDPTTAKLAGSLIGEELINYGINFDFVYSLNAETGMASRNEGTITLDAFTSNLDLNSEYALNYIKGINENGVLACGGLFPVFNNGERQIPVNDKYFDVYRKTMKEDLDGIMINDVVYSISDSEHSALLSYSVIQDLLVEKLKYNGIISTIDMNNFSEKYNEKTDLYLKPSVLGLTAGINLFYFSSISDLCIKYYNDLIQAYNEELISAEMLDDACMSVLEMKYKYGLIEDFSYNDIHEDFNYSNTKAFIDSMKKYLIRHYSELSFEPIKKGETVYIFSFEYDFSDGAKSVGEEIKNILVQNGYNASDIKYYVANQLKTVRNLFNPNNWDYIGDMSGYDHILIIPSFSDATNTRDASRLRSLVWDYTNILFVGLGSTDAADYMNEEHPALVLYGDSEDDLISLFNYLIGK